MEITEKDAKLYHWNEDGTVKLTRYGKPMKIRYKRGRNDDPDQIYTKKPIARLMESPEFLLDEFYKYVEFNRENPILIHSVDKGEDVYTKKPRALTKIGFMAWFHKNHKFSCDNYLEAEAKYPEYKDVRKIINNVVQTNQIENALVGVFNQNIIVRMHGLVEKSEVKSSSKIELKDKININFK
jgi:hypothetical protein